MILFYNFLIKRCFTKWEDLKQDENEETDQASKWGTNAILDPSMPQVGEISSCPSELKVPSGQQM